MRIGQTSLIVFASKVVGSMAGFVATLYFARYLGAGVLGTYSLALAIVGWAGIVGKVGITGAIGKRMSEGEEADEFFTAGACALFAMLLVVGLIMLAFRGSLEAYVGRSVVAFVLVMMFANMLNGLSGATLTGKHLVHVSGLLTPVQMILKSASQIALVFVGFELAGMLTGYAFGHLLIGVAGLWIAGPSFSLPSRCHFEQIISFAKYAWLGSVERRTTGWADVTVLGLFVASDLIGVYTVAWTISTFLHIFGSAISSATFPEISSVTAEGDHQIAASILEDALRYGGLVLVPGLVGAAVVGPRLLRIYGEEFAIGGTVLTILVAAVLFRSYQEQLVTTLNAADRPDLAFRVNGLSVVANISLNLALVYLYGWIGAATATALASAFRLALSYQYTAALIDFEVPYADIGKQVLAAAVTGVVAFASLWVENTYALVQHNVVVVLVAVGLGAGAYFLVLFGISASFRTTVRNNWPFETPIP
jgi:O-antigen/teichoic acid export membrane protein